MLINAAYGLGENVVQGSVNPDEYYVFKPTLKTGFTPILQKRFSGTRNSSSSTTSGGGKMVKNVPVAPDDRAAFRHQRRRNPHARALGGDIIEDSTQRKHGRACPMDIEWAKDGHTRQTVHSASTARDGALPGADRHL